MYTQYYNLKEQPFSLTPDSHFLYLSHRHREALGHLLYGIRERKGFMLVSGEVGTGKTTLCRALIREIEKEAEVGFILNTFLSAKELLRAINEDLSCHRGARSKKELVDELNRFLLERHEAGRTVVLLIDECQNLALPVLEQLRMLSNLETEKEKLLQIVMVGQPELRDKLENGDLRQLAQRISVTYHLEPLGYREMAGYIAHRINVAGGAGGSAGATPSVRFSRAALRRIFAYSEGIPRKINIICDRALLVGYVKGARVISDRIVRKALEEIQRHPRPAGSNMKRARGALAWAAAAAVALAGFVTLPKYLGGGGKTPAPALRGAFENSMSGGGVASGAGPMQGGLLAAAAHTRPISFSGPVSAEEELAARLAASWGMKARSGGSGAGRTDLAGLAGRYGMNALACWADAGFITRANLPCLVRLRGAAGGAETAALVESAQGNALMLALAGGGEVTFDLAALNERMRGRVIYFIPREAALPGILAPGMTGPAVGRLHECLRAEGCLTADEGAYYGSATAEAVRRFQARNGLAGDGIAGPGELLLLYGARAGRGAPHLIRDATGRAPS